MMSALSSTGFGAPCFAASSIARPTSSVVVKYPGKSALKTGERGPNTAYTILYNRVFEVMPCRGWMNAGRNMYARWKGSS